MNAIPVEIEQWISRKLSHRQSHVLQAATASFTYRKIAGPKILFGEVTLSASPSDTFSFTSKAMWINDESCESYVLDGIVEILLSSSFYPVLGASFVLEKIGWHEIESVPIGYYFAAKEATKQILKLDDKNKNFK